MQEAGTSLLGPQQGHLSQCPLTRREGKRLEPASAVSSPMKLALGSDTSQGAESLIDSTLGDVQKVLSSRQWQPHPVGHTSWVLNHSIMWLVWPPWPQVRQKLDEPRTATWQMAHWKVKPLQRAHCVPRTSLRQWLQYTPNSIPL